MLIAGAKSDRKNRVAQANWQLLWDLGPKTTPVPGRVCRSEHQWDIHQAWMEQGQTSLGKQGTLSWWGLGSSSSAAVPSIHNTPTGWIFLLTRGHWLIDTLMGDTSWLIKKMNSHSKKPGMKILAGINSHQATVVLCDLETMSSGAFRWFESWAQTL
jgi:hypothetical protein